MIKTSTSIFYKFFATSKFDFNKAQKYVIEKLRSRDWQTYIITSHLPKSLRTPYCTIHLFNLQIIKISDSFRQPSLAFGKMEFWNNTINKIYSSEQPNQQPISISLNHACHHHPLTKGYFTRIISGRTKQIQIRNVQTIDQLVELAQQTQGPLIALQLQLLRCQIANQNVQKVITYLSRSIGLCDYIKRIPYGLRNYRFFIPLNLLAKHNLNTRNIWDRIRGQPAEQLFDAVLQIAALSKQYFEEAVRIFEKNQECFPKQSFRAFLKGVQIQLYLQNLQKYNFNIFEKGVNKPHLITLPYRLLKSTKNKKFYV